MHYVGFVLISEPSFFRLRLKMGLCPLVQSTNFLLRLFLPGINEGRRFEATRNLLISATSRKLEIRNMNRCSRTTELDNLVLSPGYSRLFPSLPAARKIIPGMTFCAIVSGSFYGRINFTFRPLPVFVYKSNRTRSVQIAPSEKDNYAKSAQMVN